MTPLSKNQAVKLGTGTVITGKWHKNRYHIVKKLGSGAIGVVYLVKSQKGLAALKIGFDQFGITSEVNVLKHFSKVQGKSLGPYFIEMDDWIEKGFRSTFYVMEYIQGKPLHHFLQEKGKEWTGILITQLLSDLEQLHGKGWIFGDLKPDNLLVSSSPPRIRWLDVGGTTQVGRAIKEYTEFFDRGYWGLGSRKAEPSYDLFSVAMVFLNAAYPNRFQKRDDAITQLQSKVAESALLKRYQPIIMNAIHGHYDTANAMKVDMIKQLNGSFQQRQEQKRSRYNQRKKKRSKKMSGWMETMIVVSFFLMVYLLYLFGNLF